MENQEIQEQLNALESRRLELETKISGSDRAALDYVKSLPGFAEAYPEFARDFEAARAEEDSVSGDVADLERTWELLVGQWVNAGDEIIYKGVRYEVLQGHYLQEDWLPDQLPALYRRKGDPGDEWPEWVQPTGAHAAYNKGDKVSHDGKHWVSDVDANVWEPGVYGWSEVV